MSTFRSDKMSKKNLTRQRKLNDFFAASAIPSTSDIRSKELNNFYDECLSEELEYSKTTGLQENLDEEDEIGDSVIIDTIEPENSNVEIIQPSSKCMSKDCVEQVWCMDKCVPR